MIETPISAASQESDATAYLQVAPTPFYLSMLAACPSNSWCTWNGFTVPDTFTTVDEEYDALHTAVGMTDVSPLARYRIKGAHADEYANRLLTVDVANQSIGQIITSPMCDMRGGTIDVVDLLRMAVDEFWLVSEKSHLPWLLDSAIGFDITVDYMTQNIAALRLTGPSSGRMLEAIGAHASSGLPEGRSQIERLGDIAIRVLRKSGHRYPTFDLWMQAAQGQSVWSLFSHRKAETDLLPIGTTASEILRIEEGRLRCGVDFLSSTSFQDPLFRRTPVELGFGEKLDTEKCYFNGRQVLLKSEPIFAVIGLDFEENRVVSGESLRIPGTETDIGTVLSATWSPTLKSNIAIAEINLGAGALSGSYEATSTKFHGLSTQRKKALGTVRKSPFLPIV